MSSIDSKDPTRVAAGLKAAMNNPNVSTEAKDNAAQRLEEIVGDVRTGSVDADDFEESELSGRQAGGYKATLSSGVSSVAHLSRS